MPLRLQIGRDQEHRGFWKDSMGAMSLVSDFPSIAVHFRLQEKSDSNLAEMLDNMSPKVAVGHAVEVADKSRPERSGVSERSYCHMPPSRGPGLIDWPRRGYST